MTDPSPSPTPPATPFERIGGRPAIARLVDRFYDAMETAPDFAGLRAIHQADLTPMHEKLTDFLVAWMGGPRDWFDKNPGACIMSAHGGMPGIDRDTAAQWVACMAHAADEIRVGDPDLARAMIEAMDNMCRVMAANAQMRRDTQAAASTSGA